LYLCLEKACEEKEYPHHNSHHWTLFHFPTFWWSS